MAVLGLSSSSAAGLNAEIAALGTNLLTVQPGQSFSGTTAELPIAAPAMIARLPGVYQVQSTGSTDVNVYRSPLIPAVNTNALTVSASTLGLPATAGTSVAQGEFLNAATAREPVCVLGAAAAQLLGIDKVFPGERVWITGVNGSGGMWLYVAGILNPDVLAPDVDSSVLVGFPFAQQYLGFDGHPSTVYVKATDSQVNEVYNLLGAQANPENPSGVDVSQPSDALVAQVDAKSAFNTLFLGLGAVALLVGAIGVANIMVIAVLERRSEIGLRRALGATRGHIRIQFLAEAIALSLLGGVRRRHHRCRRHRDLRPRQGLGHRHPHRRLGRRAGRRRPHRRPRRAAARDQGRPPLPDPGPVVPMTVARRAAAAGLNRSFRATARRCPAPGNPRWTCPSRARNRHFPEPTGVRKVEDMDDMNDGRAGPRGRTGRPRRRRACALTAVVAGASLLAAACGGP